MALDPKVLQEKSLQDHLEKFKKIFLEEAGYEIADEEFYPREFNPLGLYALELTEPRCPIDLEDYLQSSHGLVLPRLIEAVYMFQQFHADSEHGEICTGVELVISKPYTSIKRSYLVIPPQYKAGNMHGFLLCKKELGDLHKISAGTIVYAVMLAGSACKV